MFRYRPGAFSLSSLQRDMRKCRFWRRLWATDDFAGTKVLQIVSCTHERSDLAVSQLTRLILIDLVTWSKFGQQNKCCLWLSFLSLRSWVSAKMCLICWKIEPWPEIPEMRWICSVMYFQKWYLSLRFDWSFELEHWLLDWIETLPFNPQVVGSIPTGPTKLVFDEDEKPPACRRLFLFRTLWTYNYRGRRRHPVASPSNWFADSRVCFYDTLMVR